MLQLKGKFCKQFHKISHYVKRYLMAIGKKTNVLSTFSENDCLQRNVNNRPEYATRWIQFTRPDKSTHDLLKYISMIHINDINTCWIWKLFFFLFPLDNTLQSIQNQWNYCFWTNWNVQQQRRILFISRRATSQSGSFICRTMSHGRSYNCDTRAIRTLLWNG